MRLSSVCNCYQNGHESILFLLVRSKQYINTRIAFQSIQTRVRHISINSTHNEIISQSLIKIEAITINSTVSHWISTVLNSNVQPLHWFQMFVSIDCNILSNRPKWAISWCKRIRECFFCNYKENFRFRKVFNKWKENWNCVLNVCRIAYFDLLLHSNASIDRFWIVVAKALSFIHSLNQLKIIVANEQKHKLETFRNFIQNLCFCVIKFRIYSWLLD